ncbi:MAG: BLUF domain-containing protein [Flavobacteriaceae bacterium]
MLKYIAYVSRQSFILSEEEITNLLVNCRVNNSRNNISGMLLYFDGTFVQYLEGPKEQVETLFQKISKDKRHHEVVTLMEGDAKQREFEDWSMAYKQITASEVEKITGRRDFKKEDLFKGKNPESEHPGIVLLRSFVNNLHI